MVPETKRGQEPWPKHDGDQKILNLVNRAISGDHASLEDLIGLFHKKIFCMVYYRTGSRMDAEDLTQEIFLKMSKALGRLKNPALFKAWLYRIAVNRIKDYYRKKRLLSFFTDTGAVEVTVVSPCISFSYCNRTFAGNNR